MLLSDPLNGLTLVAISPLPLGVGADSVQSIDHIGPIDRLNDRGGRRQ
jgi:hypothetical protein